MEQLKPLFDEAESKPGTGVVLGQAWQMGSAVFQFVAIDEVVALVEKAKAKAEANDNTIKPAGWA